MSITVILAMACALIIGLVLGLIGGGGSILTVPILTYIAGIEPELATAYSLFVVGVSALVGTVRYAQQGTVNFKTGTLFAIPSLITVFATRLLIIPAIPDEILTIGSFVLTKGLAIMVFFGLVMLLAAFSMIRSKKGLEKKSHEQRKPNIPLIIVEGVVVGLLTGLVGAGGGFLIIPALVLLVGMEMKEAVATSLYIITLKSLIGFLGDVGADQPIDWTFLGIFSALSVVGIFIGVYLSNKVNSGHLKKAFGYFVLVMAVFIIVKELFLP